MFLRIDFRTFVHATEDEGRVRAALDFVSGGAPVERSEVEGYHGNPIVVLQAQIGRAGDIEQFWRMLSGEGQLTDIGRQLERRFDDDLTLHMKLDKQEAYLGRLRLADHDDAIIVRAKVASYPAKRSLALPSLAEYIQEVGNAGSHAEAG